MTGLPDARMGAWVPEGLMSPEPPQIEAVVTSEGNQLWSRVGVNGPALANLIGRAVAEHIGEFQRVTMGDTDVGPVVDYQPTLIQFTGQSRSMGEGAAPSLMEDGGAREVGAPSADERRTVPGPRLAPPGLDELPHPPEPHPQEGKATEPAMTVRAKKAPPVLPKNAIETWNQISREGKAKPPGQPMPAESPPKVPPKEPERVPSHTTEPPPTTKAPPTFKPPPTMQAPPFLQFLFSNCPQGIKICHDGV